MLHPYLDGELSAAESEVFAEHLRSCDTCRDELKATKALRLKVKAAFPPSSAPEAVRTTIRAAIEKEAPTRRKTSFVSWRITSIAASIAIAALSIWMFTHRGSSLDPEEAEAQEFVTHHIRSVVAGSPTELTSNNVSIVQSWIAMRMGFSPSTTDLTGVGFTLVGSRVDTVANKRAAVVVYRYQGHLIDVFEFPRGSHVSDDVHHWDREGYRVVSFCRGSLRYWVVGDPSQEAMNRLIDHLRQS